jgi:hypothetical protein
MYDIMCKVESDAPRRCLTILPHRETFWEIYDKIYFEIKEV